MKEIKIFKLKIDPPLNRYSEYALLQNLEKIYHVFIPLYTLKRLEKWEEFKEKIAKKEGKRCWICGKKDNYGEVEEFWEYNDKKHIQTLVGIHYLCERCSLVKNGKGSPIFWRSLGLKGSCYRRKELINHFCKVNRCSVKQFKAHEKEIFKIWKKRNKYEWRYNLGKFSKQIFDLFQAQKINKIEFFIGEPRRNLLFTSFSILCLKLRCQHLWTKFRNRLVKTLHYRCSLCGAKEKLHLHEPHKIDNKRLTFKLLKPYLLCSDCHDRVPSFWGIKVRYIYGQNSDEEILDGTKINQIIEKIKYSLERHGVNAKQYKAQIKHLIHQLKNRNWNKNYKKIEFDKVYNPLIEDILNHLNGRVIKVDYLWTKELVGILLLLKKSINRRNFGCIITAVTSKELGDYYYPDFHSSLTDAYKIPLKVLKKKVPVSRLFLKISKKLKREERFFKFKPSLKRFFIEK